MTDTTLTGLNTFEPESLHEAVHLGVGSASACWENLRGAGVFQDDKAREVAQWIIDYVEANYEPKGLAYRSKHDVIRPEDDPDQLLLFDFDQA